MAVGVETAVISNGKRRENIEDQYRCQRHFIRDDTESNNR